VGSAGIIHPPQQPAIFIGSEILVELLTQGRNHQKRQWKNLFVRISCV
jgi:hypothetical protein